MKLFNFILNLGKEHKKVSNKIQESLNISNFNSILDVGGGSGLLAYHLSKYSSKIEILEPSKKMNKHNDFNFKIHESTIQEFSEKSKFDFVICFDSLHHFSNLHDNKKDEIIKGIKKMVSLAEKKVIIIEPNYNKIRTKYLRLIENVLLRSGSYFLKRDEIPEIFNGLNYKVSSWRKYLIIEIDIQKKS